MKKLLFILLLIPILSYSQAKIGYTKELLVKELTSMGLEVKEMSTEKDYSILVVNIDTLATVAHRLYKDSSYGCIIVPKNNNILNYYVKRYNKMYVSISHDKWLAYSEYYICEIELIYDEELGYIFVWSIKE